MKRPSKAALPYQDVRLVKLCAAYAGCRAEGDALAEPFYCSVDSLADAVRPKVDMLVDRGHRLQALIASSPARTEEGLKAKARALLASLGEQDAIEGPQTTLARGLAADVLRIVGGDTSGIR
jgi:hypothetical protein